MGDYHDDNGVGGSLTYNRPRRPDPQTVSYLRGLSLDIQQSHNEIKDFLTETTETEAEFPQSFAAAISAVDEVSKEIASLAGDEHGSQCIEVLSSIATPYSELAARVLLHSCLGYYLHLSTHRYGSHVVQTLLQLSVSSASSSYDSTNNNKNKNKWKPKDDLALHEDSPELSSLESLPSLSELIQGIVDELIPHASQLAIHVCGSHVLRTLLCVLGDVNLVTNPSRGGGGGGIDPIVMETGAMLRGKQKKKKKKKKSKPAGEDDSSSSPTSSHNNIKIEYRKNSRVKQHEFSNSLESLALALLGDNDNDGSYNEPGELQQLSCHSSAGPLLIVLLKVLTYSTDTARNEFDQQQQNQDIIADFRLGINSPEPKFEVNSLAHTVVKRLLCISDDEEKEGNGEEQQAKKHAGDIIYGMSGEPRGSHLLETILILSPDSVHTQIVKYGDFLSPESMQAYVEHEVSNFVIQTLLTSIRSKEEAETILKVVEKVISNGLAIDPSKKRRGILWRATELSAKFRVGQESILKSIRLGFATFINKNDATEQQNEESAVGEKKKTKKKERKKASAVSIQDCVVRLINLQSPTVDSDRIGLDAAGVRCVYHLLRFTPRLCEDVLKTILESYSADDLVRIAKDGLGSRCIMDGILAGATKTPVFIVAVKGLFNKLKGHWVSLATDRVGQHTVKKMFYALPKIDDKSKLADELAAGGNRLSGNAMGRNISEICLLDMYNEDPKGWRQKLSKLMSKDDTFMSKEMGKPKKTGAGEDSNEMKTKPKRKRKRNRKSTSSELLTEKDGSGGEEEDKPPLKKKEKQTDSYGVDSIVEMISLPKKKDP